MYARTCNGDIIQIIPKVLYLLKPELCSLSSYSSYVRFLPIYKETNMRSDFMVKVLSFGIISELYSILKANDQYEIAEIYHVEPDDLTVYLAILSNFRNLCAHEDILYDHKTKRIIGDTIYHKKLNIPQEEGEYIYGKNDLFAVIIILKQLLTKDDFRCMFNEICYEIDYLEGKIDVIPIMSILNQIGFPENYRDIME